MRTEEEVKVLLTRLTEEFFRAQSEVPADPIQVKKIGDATYQLTMHRIAHELILSRNILLWVLGEIEIP